MLIDANVVLIDAQCRRMVVIEAVIDANVGLIVSIDAHVCLMRATLCICSSSQGSQRRMVIAEKTPLYGR